MFSARDLCRTPEICIMSRIGPQKKKQDKTKKKRVVFHLALCRLRFCIGIVEFCFLNCLCCFELQAFGPSDDNLDLYVANGEWISEEFLLFVNILVASLEELRL